ncbi:PfkB family carbohydrate kinase [Micromonospora polyrhachis]|uniref:Ribokinase n=1 Tax=Micromonospora polyrhachis TaxID=1282883 RepID=A0A7W7WS44_9ACTN|nr:PfkB family carbohydrate kinase [Micromonospora polyrhachis]MBB4961921.1 ribokinase [Micromonospora polyrhachis]
MLFIGRANVDITVRVAGRATPGRTMFASSPAMISAGGKSLNQAIAAAGANARVGLLGNAGEDQWGNLVVQALQAAQVDTSCFSLVPSASTSAAIIEIGADGENRIILALSPETELTPEQVRTRLDCLSPPVVVTQLDLQPESVEAGLRCQHTDIRIGNLVPDPGIGTGVLAGLDLYVVNDVEAAAVLGYCADDPMDAARDLCKLGVRTAIVTVGARGAAYCGPDGAARVPADRVRVVDTSGAGDAFLGVLAAHLARKVPLRDAIVRAVEAGSTAVQHLGPRPPATT